MSKKILITAFASQKALLLMVEDGIHNFHWASTGMLANIRPNIDDI